MKTLANPFPTSTGAFLTTHWSVVQELSWPSGQLAPEKSRQALAQLCQDYWPPLYRFIRQRGYSRHDAQDLTQGFFAYLLEKQAYSRCDRSKGKFRTFLLVLLKRYLGAMHAHQGRQKRGGDRALVFLDDRGFSAVEGVEEERALLTAAPPDEERAFEWNWATALVSRAMDALKEEYSSGQKARLFNELLPFLSGGVGLPTHEGTAARLGVPLETLRSHLFRLRARYRAHLRAEVLRTVPIERDIDEELRYLCRVLLAGATR